MRTFISILSLAIMTLNVYAQKVFKDQTVYGPRMVQMPFNHYQENPNGDKFDAKLIFNQSLNDTEYLKFNSFPDLGVLAKSSAKIIEGGIQLNITDTNTAQLYYQKALLHVDKYQKTSLAVNSNSAFRISRNGEVLLENHTSPDTVENKSASVTFLKGYHPLLIELLYFPGGNKDLRFQLSVGDSSSKNVDFVNINSKSSYDLQSLIHLPLIQSAKISNDGKYAAFTVSKKNPPKGKNETWIEIWDLDKNALLSSYRGLSNVTGLNWQGSQNRISYTTKVDDKTVLWLQGLNENPRILIETDQNLASYDWSSKGDFLIYSISFEEKRDTKLANLLEGMASRVPGHYDYSYLYKLDINSRIIQQLTYGKKGTALMDISMDGNSILFATADYDYTKEPFSFSTFWKMDLNTLQSDSIFYGDWVSSMSFIPNSNKTLIIGGPSLFGDLGENIENGKVANNFDNQAYFYDLTNKNVQAISKEFDPSIQEFIISDDGTNIYFKCVKEDFNKVFKYDIKEKTYSEIIGKPDVVKSFQLSADQKRAVIIGNNIQSPSLAYTVDMKKLSSKPLYYPADQYMSEKTFGEYSDWDFKNKNGDNIDGRVYLPPNFDSTKAYPLIVYYYGGTVPVERSFAGRYPYNWYASQGYVVYVVQPRGTTGYGQNFSADHVNNWGKTSALDIIEGTEKFVAEHKYINKDAIGCIGASYGGFMTMYLLTQTDIFSAAVSHAGISSLSSYWGEGYWGYAYSSVASSGSYPWNRKDIYVDQSPLFQADKVNTPLLLTHGASDTNVPPGESYQFYSALKILGKEVELLEVPGQDHWVLEYEKYINWKYSIIAWFDKHLKKEEAWWNDLYSE